MQRMAAVVLLVSLPCAFAADAQHFSTEDGRKIMGLFNQAQAAYKTKNFQQYADLNRQIVCQKLSAQALADVAEIRVHAEYNFACGLALTGKTAEALKTLASAVENGYDRADELKRDGDLKSLRQEKQFESILARIAELKTQKKAQWTGKLFTIAHESQLGLAVTGEDKATPVRVLRLHPAAAGLEKKAAELQKKDGLVAVTGAGGGLSSGMAVAFSEIAAQPDKGPAPK